jgi:hypothetical protein
MNTSELVTAIDAEISRLQHALGIREPTSRLTSNTFPTGSLPVHVFVAGSVFFKDGGCLSFRTGKKRPLYRVPRLDSFTMT